MRISKRFRFEAAHRLPRYEGPCYHLHGHSYELHVTLEMPVDRDTGMTVDFFKLEAAVRELSNESKAGQRSITDERDTRKHDDITARGGFRGATAAAVAARVAAC